jgi:hypothetical protein
MAEDSNDVHVGGEVLLPGQKNDQRPGESVVLRMS